MLTPAQLASNRMDLPAQSKNVLDAPGCQWSNKAHTREIRDHVDTTNDVLHDVYAQRTTFAVFEVTQVAGCPAIRTKDLMQGTSCTFTVAVAERQTFVVEFTSLRQGLEEPCGPARALAEDVVANLPPLKGWGRDSSGYQHRLQHCVARNDLPAHHRGPGHAEMN